MSSDKPRILVVGCGSIGRRHIRLLREMGVDVVAHDADPDVCERVRREFDLPVEHGDPDGAIIATPTHIHCESALLALLGTTRAEFSIMVEKPLAHTHEQAMVIQKCVAEEGASLLVGYCLRWHPGLQRGKALLDSGAIGKPLHAAIRFGHYLPDWHLGQDYRRWYSAHREQGGGVLLDASHELDYACWLFGEPVSVSATVQNSGTLAIDCEDIADVTLRFASGAQANIHLNYLDRHKQRWCRIVGEQGSLFCDLTRDAYMTLLDDQEKFPGGYAWQAFQPDDMYRAELRHFLAVCRGEEQPLVTGADGLRAVRIVEAAKKSSATGRVAIL